MMKVTRTQVREEVTGILSAPPHKMDTDAAMSVAERLITKFEELTIENENSWNGER